MLGWNFLLGCDVIGPSDFDLQLFFGDPRGCEITTDHREYIYSCPLSTREAQSELGRSL